MIEAGHMGQNLFLQAEALGLKAGNVGAFHDKELIEIMKIPCTHEPLLIMSVGYAAYDPDQATTRWLSGNSSRKTNCRCREAA